MTHQNLSWKVLETVLSHLKPPVLTRDHTDSKAVFTFGAQVTDGWALAQVSVACMFRH